MKGLRPYALTLLAATATSLPTLVQATDVASASAVGPLWIVRLTLGIPLAIVATLAMTCLLRRHRGAAFTQLLIFIALDIAFAQWQAAYNWAVAAVAAVVGVCAAVIIFRAMPPKGD